MSLIKLILAAAAATLLTACAATGPGVVEKHNHMADNKQGVAYPAATGASAPKPLHDHREWK